jgi:hypothetical protein
MKRRDEPLPRANRDGAVGARKTLFRERYALSLHHHEGPVSEGGRLVTDGFDVHAVRHRLKLKKDAGHSSLFETRDAVACPACDDPFAEVFTTEKRAHSFQPTGSMRFCVVREDGRTLLFTHD